MSERYWSRVDIRGEDDCWLWTGPKDRKGYGRWHHANSHRGAYELSVGPIPKGIVVRHTCDVPACCNPRHLVLGTYKDNSLDCIERRRIAHGEKSGASKLTEEQVRYIRENPERMTGRALAKRFCVNEHTVSRIKLRNPQHWKYLP